MAAYQIKLPDVGEGVTEAEIVEWHVALGDDVVEEQNIVDIMTDKATVETPSPVAGRIVKLHGAVGDIAAVGSVLVELEVLELEALGGEPSGAPGEAVSPSASPGATPSAPPQDLTPADTADPPEVSTTAPQPERPRPAENPPSRLTPVGDAAPLAAPATRRRAYELGVPLQFVPGTGPGGRITPADLDAYLASGRAGTAMQSSQPAAARRLGVHETNIIGLRRKIAERMQDAKSRIPHFSYVEEFDLTDLEAFRKDLNAEREDGQPKLTLLPFFMRALVLLQPEFPHINARYDDEANVLATYDGVHIGIATQTPGGLMVPVVRHAETLDLWESARELLRVTGAARAGTATREELAGSTITLTSLGALGGIAATPVINAPEVAIIGPNKLVDRPVVLDGQIAVRTLMNLSTSFDHRIVDGHDAARFVQRLKRLIERPAHLFVGGR